MQKEQKKSLKQGGSARPRRRLTSLMAVQNSLWSTFFRDWSLCPGTSPDSCSFSSSSMALATSGERGHRSASGWAELRRCGESLCLQTLHEEKEGLRS